MELQDQKDCWRLVFQTGLLQLIQVDFRLGLFLSDVSGKAQLFVETPCHLKGPNIDAILDPAKPSSLAPMLALFNNEVIAVVAQKTGKLEVRFGGDHTLEVDPHDTYEAWQLGCSTGVMLVCSPGGEVSFFNKPHTNANKK